MNDSETQSDLPTYKILIDVTFLFDQYSKRGIGRYGKEILRRIIKLIIEEKNWKLHLVGFWDLEKSLMEMQFSKLAIEEIAPHISYHSFGRPYLSTLKNAFRWRKNYARVIDEVGPDIFYAVHFERGLPTVPRFSKTIIQIPKTVVVTHDVIPLVINKFSEKGFIQNILKSKFYKFMFQGVQKADMVLTPSNFSKEDLIKYGQINPENIRVIYLGISDIFNRENYDKKSPETNTTLERLQLKDKKYFFYDSGVEPNKGVRELLEIFKYTIEKNGKNNELPKFLALAGGDFTPGVGTQIKAKTKLGNNFIKIAKDIGVLDNIITLGFVTDDELIIALMNSQAYIYLSQYEGFGFGPIQAMRAKIPSIVANRSCLPEITDGGSLVVDTADSKGSAKKIHDFLGDKESVSKLVKKGRKISEKYNWDETAIKTWTEIKKLVSEEV